MSLAVHRFMCLLPAISFMLFPLLLHAVFSAEPIDYLISELQQFKLKIAHLESVLEEHSRKLNERNLYLRECEKRLHEVSEKLHYLQSTFSSVQADSFNADKQVKALEEEVQHLWAASRRNNFDLHILESKAQDADNRLEEVTAVVEKMGDIMTEQWIQVQHLEQALHITEMRTLKAQRQAGFSRCTFFKFINILLDDLGTLKSYLLGEGTMVSSLTSDAMDQLKRIFSMAKKYHHQLQGFTKDLMKRHELTAAFANDELVFFLASALVIFPVMSAWVLLSS